MLNIKKLINKKEFKKLEKERELNIVGFSSLQRYDKKKHKKYREMISTNGKSYVVKKEMSGITCKYADCGNDSYVAIKLPTWLFISPLLAVYLIL